MLCAKLVAAGVGQGICIIISLTCVHRLLYGDMLESSCSEIPLGDTPPKAFGIILEYMYSGKVSKVDLQVNLADWPQLALT